LRRRPTVLRCSPRGVSRGSASASLGAPRTASLHVPEEPAGRRGRGTGAPPGRPRERRCRTRPRGGAPRRAGLRWWEPPAARAACDAPRAPRARLLALEPKGARTRHLSRQSQRSRAGTPPRERDPACGVQGSVYSGPVLFFSLGACPMGIADGDRHARMQCAVGHDA